MKIGPKYKIARRLGAGVFDKTQTPKYQARAERRIVKFSRPRSGYGAQLIEKQKVRFTYGISDKQFKNYVKNVLKKGKDQNQSLYEALESRLDNTVYRSGLASTRQQARQFVSHGHIKVNNKKVNIPSFRVSTGDVISIRKESSEKSTFINIEERIKETAKQPWLKIDGKSKRVSVDGIPHYDPVQEFYDLSAVFEYYRR